MTTWLTRAELDRQMELIDLYRAGWTLSALAKRYSVSRTSVRNHLAGWKVELREAKSARRLIRGEEPARCRCCEILLSESGDMDHAAESDETGLCHMCQREEAAS